MSENPYTPPAADLSQPIDAESIELASRGKRLGAAIIDTFVLMAIQVPIWMLFGVWEQMTTGVQPDIGQLALLSGIGLIVYLAVNGYLLATRGQSVGKMLLKIQIVDHTSSELLSLAKLVGLRMLPLWVASMIPMLGNLVGIIDVLFIFGKQRRCVHDMIAGTKVINYVPA